MKLGVEDWDSRDICVEFRGKNGEESWDSHIGM